MILGLSLNAHGTPIGGRDSTSPIALQNTLTSDQSGTCLSCEFCLVLALAHLAKGAKCAGTCLRGRSEVLGSLPSGKPQAALFGSRCCRLLVVHAGHNEGDSPPIRVAVVTLALLHIFIYSSSR